MDIDPDKPVYVFVLDFSDTGKPTNEGDLPADLLSQCRHLGDVTTSEDKPAIAVRGSTAPLGSWNVDGVRAATLATDRYAVLINDYLPKDTQYKWLNMNGISITGDIDPATGYHYEPDPFEDRTIIVGEEVVLGDIVFVFNTWGTYSTTVHKDFLDRWLPDTAADTTSAEETVEAPVVDDDATETDTTGVLNEKEPEVSSDLTAVPEIKGQTSSDQSLDATVESVTEHYETEKTEPGDDEEEKQETETSEKEITVSIQEDVAVTTTVDTVGNETDPPVITAGDEVKDENAMITVDAPEEKAREEQEVVVDLENEVLEEMSEEAVTSVSEASTDITIKDEESQIQANDQSSTQTPTDEPEDDKSQQEAHDVQIKDEGSIDVTVKDTESQIPAKDQSSTQTPIDESEDDKGQQEEDDAQIKDEASTDITVKNEESQGQGNDQKSIQSVVDEAEEDERQKEADDAQIEDEASLVQEGRGESENDESFMASEEIEMTITTISSQIVQGGNITGQTVDQDMENNNTVVSQEKVTEKEDVSNANESLVEKLNVSNLESSVMSSEVETLSEATFKRMSRISESDAPETDQVNEVLICSEQSQITVTKGQRIPSSSSC